MRIAMTSYQERGVYCLVNTNSCDITSDCWIAVGAAAVCLAGAAGTTDKVHADAHPVSFWYRITGIKISDDRCHLLTLCSVLHQN